MTTALSKEAAHRVLEVDLVRRVFSRSTALALSGVVGAYFVVTVSNSVGLVSVPATVTLSSLAEPALPFSRTVDPMLPTLITALLALSVVKASKFAPGFVVGTALLCGFLASTWAVLSVVALLTPSDRDGAVIDHAVAGVGLGVVAVAVTVVLTEVLPLSNRLREKQFEARLLSADEIRRRAGRRAKRVERRYPNRPYSPRQVRLLLLGTYVLTLAIVVAPAAVAWVLGRMSPEIIGWLWVASAVELSLLFLGLAAVQLGLGFVLETSGWRDERFFFALLAVFFALASAVGLVASIPVVVTLPAPFFVLGMVSAAWFVFMLATAVLPVAIPLPRWGWFGQLVIAQRVAALKRKQEHLHEVQHAAHVEAAPDLPEPPPSSPSWVKRLLRFGD